MAKAVCFRWCVPRMLHDLCSPPPKARVAGVAVTAAARLSAEAWDNSICTSNCNVQVLGFERQHPADPCTQAQPIDTVCQYASVYDNMLLA